MRKSLSGKFGLFKEGVYMSLENVISNKLRSFLTMLGIIIGVMAVIALISIVSSVSEYIMGQLSGMGGGSLTVSANGTLLKQGLTENDINDISQIENVSGLSPSVSVDGEVVCKGITSKDTSISGRGYMYFLRNDILDRGRPLLASDMAGDVNVCVCDKRFARTFFRGYEPIGEHIQVAGITYIIVGVSGIDNSIMSSFDSGSGNDGTLYIPYKNALQINKKNSVTSLEVYVEDTSLISNTINDLENLLDSTFNNQDNAYFIINMDALVDMMDTMSDMLASLLAGIASIALLVGGIGIMNMMLVSVTERTREIGLRKALGATPGIIQFQFLVESIILSLLGGSIGIILGEIISYIVSKKIGTEFVINLSAISTGFFFSLGVGIIFGWAPARRASKLNPIDALRSE